MRQTETIRRYPKTIPSFHTNEGEKSLMNLFDAINNRHSYRGPFSNQEIPRDDLLTIVEAGTKAPSGKNEQTTRFVMIDDSGIMEQINQMPGANKAVQHAKAMICCIIDKNPEAIYEGFHFQVEDCATAVENMLLAITALGYASVWVDGWIRLEHRAQQIGDLIQLPEHKIIRVILPIGVPTEEVKQEREKRPVEERAWFNCFGKSM
jgi:nitroreductase